MEKLNRRPKIGQKRGITLIALVITIIVLLILAGVSLNLIAGSDGILNKADQAVKTTEIANAKEETEMLVAEIGMDFYEGKFVENAGITGEIDEYIQNQFTDTAKKTAGGYEVTIENRNVTVTIQDKTLATGALENGKIEWRKNSESANYIYL